MKAAEEVPPPDMVHEEIIQATQAAPAHAYNTGSGLDALDGQVDTKIFFLAA